MTVRVGAKQDNFLRLELLGDLLRSRVDGPPGNAAALIDVANLTSAMITPSMTLLYRQSRAAVKTTVTRQRNGTGDEPAPVGYASARFGKAGISSQVLPCSRRPARFFWTPPHCLKKNGTCLAWH